MPMTSLRDRYRRRPLLRCEKRSSFHHLNRYRHIELVPSVSDVYSGRRGMGLILISTLHLRQAYVSQDRLLGEELKSVSYIYEERIGE